MDLTLRPARPDDADAVTAFTRETWPDRDIDDYLPRVFREWAESDDDDQRTLVAETDGAVVGTIQGVVCSPREAWVQGLRIDPAHRGRGVARELTEAVLDWARDRGASVCRNIVFSWNVASLGLARRVGFRPCTEFRWAVVQADADATPSLEVTADAGAGWSFWTASDARDHLRGLALDADRAWVLSELRPADLDRAAAADGLFVVRDGGTRGVALRNRAFEYRADDDAESERWTEYAVGAWADAEAARALVRAVARDAASLDADRARVLVPETGRFVTDAAAARADVSGHPDFVLSADLTDPSVGA
ncbi:MAG: N-acetyltransferase family protein [Haloplanus sp.]